MNEVIRELLESVYGEPVAIRSSRAVGGGSINQTQILSLANGERVFLKYNSHPPENMFPAEMRGLNLLRSAADGPRVPRPLGMEPGSRPRYFLLEYVEESSPADGFYPRFAEALANLHRTHWDRHGLDHDNFIGSTVQDNTPEADAIVFFRERRLGFQQALARKSGLLPAALDKNIDRLCERLADFLDVTDEKPSLLHGDLWSGNYFAAEGQTPCLFDPAAHYGLREADLAMTELFGSLPEAFYKAYDEVYPLNPGYRERKDLYNLYHLLNHLNLFGNAYLGSVESAVHRYIR